MLKVIQCQVRKNLETPFLKMEVANIFQQNIKEKYIDTGKLIRTEQKMSADQLSDYTILYWKTHEDYFDYVTDEECHEVNLGWSKINTELKINTLLEIVND